MSSQPLENSPCPLCSSKVLKYKINFASTFFMCEKQECFYPFASAEFLQFFRSPSQENILVTPSTHLNNESHKILNDLGATLTSDSSQTFDSEAVSLDQSKDILKRFDSNDIGNLPDGLLRSFADESLLDFDFKKSLIEDTATINQDLTENTTSGPKINDDGNLLVKLEIQEKPLGKLSIIPPEFQDLAEKDRLNITMEEIEMILEDPELQLEFNGVSGIISEAPAMLNETSEAKKMLNLVDEP
ncbi:hypothetical protein G9A89_015177 [Geosiphon pyriformis]|nr:hypothetical protein G9A89_015177 [Geosiphon pyriformis]